MPNMRQDNRRTSSATRQARIKGNAGGSQPRPRPTQVSTMKQQGPLKAGTRTSSARQNSPRLPNLPKNPVRGTTNTIRATGGNSRDAKINRLSAQASRITGRSPVAPKPRLSAAGKVASTAMALRKVSPAGLAYETLKARPTADGTLAYNQKLAASMMKKKKK
jgi:hypothetical protein